MQAVWCRLWRARPAAIAAALLLVLLGGCAASKPPPSSSESATAESSGGDSPAASESSGAESPAAEAPGAEFSSEQASGTEPPDQPASYRPAAWSDWQEDPSNLTHLWTWEHLEYRLFGEPQDYVRCEKVYTEFDKMGNFLDGEPVTVTYLLPPICQDDSVLEFDRGFANGPIKCGELPPLYYTLQQGENPYQIDEGNFARSTLAAFAWGEPAEPIATRENVDGGVYETEAFLRGIAKISGGPADDDSNNHLVRYYIRLDENRLVSLYFYVSAQATAKDLALYDAVANSLCVSPA